MNWFKKIPTSAHFKLFVNRLNYMKPHLGWAKSLALALMSLHPPPRPPHPPKPPPRRLQPQRARLCRVVLSRRLQPVPTCLTILSSCWRPWRSRRPSWSLPSRSTDAQSVLAPAAVKACAQRQIILCSSTQLLSLNN